ITDQVTGARRNKLLLSELSAIFGKQNGEGNEDSPLNLDEYPAEKSVSMNDSDTFPVRTYYFDEDKGHTEVSQQKSASNPGPTRKSLEETKKSLNEARENLNKADRTNLEKEMVEYHGDNNEIIELRQKILQYKATEERYTQQMLELNRELQHSMREHENYKYHGDNKEIIELRQKVLQYKATEERHTQQMLELNRQLEHSMLEHENYKYHGDNKEVIELRQKILQYKATEERYTQQMLELNKQFEHSMREMENYK
ncbi:7882_t:CDS:2, partial [Paraglomus brasilianum]